MKPLYKKLILWALLLLHISLIFSFSLQSAEKSTVLSRGFTDSVKTTEQFEEELRNELDDDGNVKFKSERTVKKLAEQNYLTLEGIIRKLAHITLFFILGIYLNLLLEAYGTGRLLCSIISLIYAAAVALLDETIQLFSAGRAGLISDVFIDLAGVAVASIFFFAGGKIYEKIKEKRLEMDS